MFIRNFILFSAVAGVYCNVFNYQPTYSRVSAKGAGGTTPGQFIWTDSDTRTLVQNEVDINRCNPDTDVRLLFNTTSTLTSTKVMRYYGVEKIKLNCLPLKPTTHKVIINANTLKCTNFGTLDPRVKGRVTTITFQGAAANNAGALFVQPLTGYGVVYGFGGSGLMSVELYGVDKNTNMATLLTKNVMDYGTNPERVCEALFEDYDGCVRPPDEPMTLVASHEDITLGGGSLLKSFCSMNTDVLKIMEQKCGTPEHPSTILAPSKYTIKDRNGVSIAIKDIATNASTKLAKVRSDRWPIKASCDWCTSTGNCVTGHELTVNLKGVAVFTVKSLEDQAAKTVLEGTEVTLKCHASVTKPPELPSPNDFMDVQWYFWPKDTKETWSPTIRNSPGRNSKTYTFTVGGDQSGVHSCVVKNPNSAEWIQGNYPINVFMKPFCQPVNNQNIQYATWKNDKEFSTHWACRNYRQWDKKDREFKVIVPELAGNPRPIFEESPSDCSDIVLDENDGCYKLTIVLPMGTNAADTERYLNDYVGKYGISVVAINPNTTTLPKDDGWVKILAVVETTTAANVTGAVAGNVGVKEDGANLWWIAIVIAILILLIVLLVIIGYCQRNKGESYSVDKKERGAGHDPIKELREADFPEYVPAGGMGSRVSIPESIPNSDTDSLNPYGEIDMGKFNEDGSFIGAYRGDQNNRTTNV